MVYSYWLLGHVSVETVPAERVLCPVETVPADRVLHYCTNLTAVTHLVPEFTKLFCVLAKDLFSSVLEAGDPVVVGEVRQVHLSRTRHDTVRAEITDKDSDAVAGLEKNWSRRICEMWKSHVTEQGTSWKDGKQKQCSHELQLLLSSGQQQSK